MVAQMHSSAMSSNQKKKSQAMRIVRTVGQAFEVCHKLSLALATSTACSTVHEDIEESHLTDPSQKGKCQGDGASEPNSCDTQTEEAVTSKSQDFIARSSSPLTLDNSEITKKVYNEAEKDFTLPSEVSEGASLSLYHHIQLLREQLEQQNQQMQAVVGQVQLLRDQLAAETTARLEAQAQNHHLLAHNRELLEHIRNLVKHIHEVETKFHINGKGDISFLPSEPSSLPQMSSTSDITSSYPGSLLQSECIKTGSSANTFGRSVPEGVAMAVSHDQFIDSFLQKVASNSFGRQLSVPSVTVPSSSGSPRLGAVARDPFLTGLSLPGSPSQCSFTSDTELLFKQQTPVNNSPKLSRSQVTSNKATDDILNSFLNVQGKDAPLEQPYVCFPSASSPHHQKSKGDRTQTSDFLSNSHTISSLFHDDDRNAKFSPEEKNLPHLSNHQNSLPLSKFSPLYEKSVQHSTNEESFIAQVTRDIAKMNVIERESATGTYESHSDSSFPSLFKS